MSVDIAITSACSQSPTLDRAGEVVAAELRQVALGDDAELRRQVLDEHRHEVRGEHDPQQEVAELRAALDVRGEVARVDVRDRGDERRAEHRERRTERALREHDLERAPRVRDRAALDDGRRDGLRTAEDAGLTGRASPVRARRRARAPRRRRGRRAARRTAAARSPRRRRPARSRARRGSGASPGRRRRRARTCPARPARARTGCGCRPARSSGRGSGSGSPCGSSVGLPSFAAMSSSSSSEMTCSSTSASACTSSQLMPRLSTRYSSSRRWWRMTSSATRRPWSVSRTPRYGSWTTRPSPVSFRSIPETEPGRTPSRSARAVVDTRLVRGLERVDGLDVVLDGGRQRRRAFAEVQACLNHS